MERLAPAGDVYQAGTLSGTRSRPRPGSRCCAGCATRRVYEELERRGARLEEGLARVRHASSASARC